MFVERLDACENKSWRNQMTQSGTQVSGLVERWDK